MNGVVGSSGNAMPIAPSASASRPMTSQVIRAVRDNMVRTLADSPGGRRDGASGLTARRRMGLIAGLAAGEVSCSSASRSAINMAR